MPAWLLTLDRLLPVRHLLRRAAGRSNPSQPAIALAPHAGHAAVDCGFRTRIGAASACRHPFDMPVIECREEAAATGPAVWTLDAHDLVCRDAHGRFDLQRYAERAASRPVGMIELRPWQGPAEREPVACGTSLELMLSIERLRRLSGGKPTGLSAPMRQPKAWFALVKAMQVTRVVPDFIVVEAPSTSAPTSSGLDDLQRVHETLAGVGLRDRIRIGCAGHQGSVEDIVRSLAAGADWCRLSGALSADQLASLRAGLRAHLAGAGLQHPRELVGADRPTRSARAEHAVARVAEARHDVAVVVELPVDRRRVDRHVGMVGVEA